MVCGKSEGIRRMRKGRILVKSANLRGFKTSSWEGTTRKKVRRRTAEKRLIATLKKEIQPKKGAQ